ncbi:MAG: hypothetical protein PHT33_11435 [bacterium]|nr:hypothetical protein [bacterium]
MKEEYDFSKGERGKFYHKNVRSYPPIYLDDENFEFVEKIARKKKVDLSAVVNEMIKGDKELAKAITV